LKTLPDIVRTALTGSDSHIGYGLSNSSNCSDPECHWKLFPPCVIFHICDTLHVSFAYAALLVLNWLTRVTNLSL